MTGIDRNPGRTSVPWPRMRKVVLFTAAGLDGFIARFWGDVDWLFHGKSPSQEFGFRHCQPFENGLV